ncbi:50S ribosomal protein L3 [Candidatus Woesearchaeota archaeon]|nr:50S ribosomal protein L3 [Candidatus Woesearchaeota archaeon]
MSTTRRPRDASLQYWPRKRAKSEVARVRRWAKLKEAKILGFAGYKAGMTHIIVDDNRPNSKIKGKQISLPVTVIECPPLKSASVVLYKKTGYGLAVASQFVSEKLDKELAKRISMPKKTNKKIDDLKLEDFDDIRLQVYTQPKLTNIGKKAPEIFEVALSGSKEEKMKLAKEKLGKEISVKEVFSEGQQVDIHSITKGKGLQGPVKRHGVALKSHKAEKSRRAAVLNAEGDAKVRFYAHQSGQMGYHRRTEYNKWLLKIGEPKEVNPRGDFIRYGSLKNQVILLKGSVGGPKKRMIRFNHAIRSNYKVPKDAPKIRHISLKSNQGS